MAANPADRATRLALSCVIEGGEPAVAEVTAISGAEAAWQQVTDGRFGEGLAERAAQLDLDRVLARAARSRARFLVLGDEEWPDRLGDLRYCDEVQRRGECRSGSGYGVPAIWDSSRNGPSRSSVREPPLRTARPSPPISGRSWGSRVHGRVRRWVRDRHGGSPGALAAAAPTIAVVANGVDVAYPQGNRKLFDWVAGHGLIVSELPPGTHPSRVRFLARNRLIAAMSVGTVVVEAALRSGARNTASWASGCGRVLMAVRDRSSRRCRPRRI